LKNATRYWLLSVLAVVLCFTAFCTIDPGDPADPGITTPGLTPGDTSGGGPGDTPPGVVLVPTIRADAERSFVGIGDTVSINAQLLSDTGATASGLSGRSITVVKSHDDDWISHSAVSTDQHGRAVVRFSSMREGQAMITFRFNNVERTVAVEVTDNPPRNITITASPSQIFADGVSRSIVTVQVINDNRNPIVNDVIRFSTNAGVITAEGITDQDGRATAELRSDRRNTVATVTATLRSDGEITARTIVEFTGVTATATPVPASIRPNNRDICTLTVSLRDAQNNPIVGERVIFTNTAGDTLHPHANPGNVDSLTNTRGEARIRIVTGTAGTLRITAHAAGTTASAAITITDQTLAIAPASSNNYIADAGHRSTFFVQYLRGDGSLVSDARIEATVTMGSFYDTENIPPDAIVFARVIQSEDGHATVIVDNPRFTGLATLYVRACPANSLGQCADDSFATGSFQFQLRTIQVDTIRIVATPAVIGINGGRARIVATVTDAHGNRVANVPISFNMANGPGGGEFIDPATAFTKEDGTATVEVVSGTIPSAFGGVDVWASDISNTRRSNAVKITMAGPPRYISLRRNMETITTPGPATYGEQLEALVSDVNGNPVADGTEVTFSAQVTAYQYYAMGVTGSAFVTNATTGERMFVRDSLTPAPIKIASEWLDRSRPYRPFPPFNDINRNGIPDRGRHVEPCDPGTRDIPGGDLFPGDFPVNIGGVNFTELRFDQFPFGCRTGVFADLNNNGVRDTIEEFFRNEPEWLALTEDMRTNLLAYDFGRIDAYLDHPAPFWDLNWQHGNGGIPRPHTAVLIERTRQTTDGRAQNLLVYGQSDASRVYVTVSAEANGLISITPEFLLPRSESARWRPWHE
jgi:hypothetical protein